MKLKHLALALALCFTGSALAQSAQMGTWKINEAKSKVPTGYMKNSTVDLHHGRRQDQSHHRWHRRQR